MPTPPRWRTRARQGMLAWQDAYACKSSLWPRERQVQQQVLRLEFQSVVAIHRHPQIDRAAGDGGKHVARLRKGELEQAQQSLHALVGDFDSIVQIVEHRTRLGIEPDVPDPARILDPGTSPARQLAPAKTPHPAVQPPRTASH